MVVFAVGLLVFFDVFDVINLRCNDLPKKNEKKAYRCHYEATAGHKDPHKLWLKAAWTIVAW